MEGTLRSSYNLITFDGERTIVPFLRHFGNINFTYHGNLWQPEFVYSGQGVGGAVVNKGAGVHKGNRDSSCFIATFDESRNI